MNSYCLIQVSFSGVGKEVVLELFNKMSIQDYKKPRYNVGMFPQNEKLENEFGLIKTYWGIYTIKYFTDFNPNLNTLKLIGKLYRVNMLIKYEFPDEMVFACAKYDCDTNQLTHIKLPLMEFIFYDFQDDF